eukprot:Nk52_evm8s1705 gene=Nk52_evmTU8s1705
MRIVSENGKQIEFTITKLPQKSAEENKRRQESLSISNFDITEDIICSLSNSISVFVKDYDHKRVPIDNSFAKPCNYRPSVPLPGLELYEAANCFWLTPPGPLPFTEHDPFEICPEVPSMGKLYTGLISEHLEIEFKRKHNLYETVHFLSKEFKSSKIAYCNNVGHPSQGAKERVIPLPVSHTVSVNNASKTMFLEEHKKLWTPLYRLVSLLPSSHSHGLVVMHNSHIVQKFESFQNREITTGASLGSLDKFQELSSVAYLKLKVPFLSKKRKYCFSVAEMSDCLPDVHCSKLQFPLRADPTDNQFALLTQLALTDEEGSSIQVLKEDEAQIPVLSLSVSMPKGLNGACKTAKPAHSLENLIQGPSCTCFSKTNEIMQFMKLKGKSSLAPKKEVLPVAVSNHFRQPQTQIIEKPMGITVSTVGTEMCQITNSEPKVGAESAKLHNPPIVATVGALKTHNLRSFLENLEAFDIVERNYPKISKNLDQYAQTGPERQIVVWHDFVVILFSLGRLVNTQAQKQLFGMRGTTGPSQISHEPSSEDIKQCRMLINSVLKSYRSFRKCAIIFEPTNADADGSICQFILANYAVTKLSMALAGVRHDNSSGLANKLFFHFYSNHPKTTADIIDMLCRQSKLQEIAKGNEKWLPMLYFNNKDCTTHEAFLLHTGFINTIVARVLLSRYTLLELVNLSLDKLKREFAILDESILLRLYTLFHLENFYLDTMGAQ